MGDLADLLLQLERFRDQPGRFKKHAHQPRLFGRVDAAATGRGGHR